MSRQEPVLRDYRGTHGTYPTTRYHWRVRDDGEQYLVLCPACDCRPCPPDCPEQFLSDQHGLWDPERAEARIAAAAEASAGGGLVQRAMAAAAQQQAEERQKREAEVVS